MGSNPNTNRIYGSVEILQSTGSEADLHQHILDCQKSPRHGEFIPVKLFDRQHLPEKYREGKLFDYIKAEAELAVKVEVKTCSPYRPEFWPGTFSPYPSYKNSGCGSGEVFNVLQFSEGVGLDVRGKLFNSKHTTCKCTKCAKKEKPSTSWWEIIVRTATHVVFDEIEAAQTICKLYYDDKHSHVITLSNLSVYAMNAETDSIMLRYVTCDNDLGPKLGEIRRQCRELWAEVCDTYKGSGDRFCFLVSHPHGCTKQVSVGEWVDSIRCDKYNDDYDMSQLTYTTSTCPGSSGAYVHSISLGGSHVHSGAIANGLNYSGQGVQYSAGKGLNTTAEVKDVA